MSINLITSFIFDPRVLMLINAIGFMAACILLGLNIGSKRPFGLGGVVMVFLVVIMVGMAVWLTQLARISLLPLFINLILAMLLPEIWHSLKDFSYFSSAKTAAFIFTLAGLSAWAVVPFWKDRSEVNLITVVLLIIFFTAVVGAAILALRFFDWLEKKEAS